VSEKQQLLRALPSLDRLLNSPEAEEITAVYGRDLTTTALRQTVAELRTAILTGQETAVPAREQIIHTTAGWLETFLAPTLFPVINASGVIVHTNLGRAPLSEKALAAMRGVGRSYNTLEYEIDAGKRGSRSVHAAQLLTRLTGCESATVVNNNAAAVLLMLTALCQGKEVIISRGQLVEIGGGFRIPDVMAQSGAKLVEVGTTNRTHLRDYAAAITENTAAILVAHYSNYKIIGFTSEPPLSELAELAHENGIMLLYDQGSGTLLETTPFGLAAEPTVPAGVAAGCDVITFSGDKLLGGPQAGMLVGYEPLIAQIKRHPLARAVRPDKLCLSALSATLTHYLADEVLTEIPVWRMIARPSGEIEAEAAAWQETLAAKGVAAEVIAGQSAVGGGSLPGTSLPTAVIAIDHPQPDQLAAALRAGDPPVITRIQDGRLLLDPRTILPGQADPLLSALTTALEETR
jgi:L-seryl-tRNA(Ser) seleniumtransferase